jgi:hypothetical protein
MSAVRPIHPLWRRVLAGAGWTIIGLGVVVAPLPGPFGLPIALGGLVLLLGNSPAARRRFVAIGRRYPRVMAPLRRLLRRRRRTP